MKTLLQQCFRGWSVNGLFILQILWPIAVIAMPFILGAGVLWLKSQFPTRAELTALGTKIDTETKVLEERIESEVGSVRDRFERGSHKFAEHDRRLALVEDDCKKSPTKNELNQGMAVLAGRMSGVESSLKGVEKQLGTQHDYLRTLLERGSDK